MKKSRAKYIFIMAVAGLLSLMFCFSACDSDSESSKDDKIVDTGYEYIVINEVQSNNTDGFLESDFVELYNTSDKPYTFREGEWYITDSNLLGINAAIMYIPGGTQIDANGHLVLLPDKDELPDDAPSGSIANVVDGINLRFGLGSEDAVYLYCRGSSNPTPDVAVDSTSWTGHVRTRVRIPDGGEWVAGDSNYPTPGSSNETVVAYAAGILINEVQSSATEGYFGSDYVELYNTTGSEYTFAAGEWYITDSDGAPEHVFYIPGGTTIASGGYLVLLPNEETLPGDAPANSIACVVDGTNSSFGLKSSDGVYLYYTGSLNPNPDVAVDSTSWTSHVTTRSRVPDGGDWSATDDRTPTPGAAN